MIRNTSQRKSPSRKREIKSPSNKSANKRDVTDVIIPVSTWRYRTVGLLFGFTFVGLVGRAVYLQVIDTEYLQKQGEARYLRVQKEPPTRGMILDRNGQPLAISTPVDSVWMHPATILKQQSEYSYKKLAALLGISREQLLSKARAKSAKQFVYLKRQVSPEVSNKIKELGVPGVNFVREFKRFYPAGPVVGHVLGFTNIDNVGQEGVELAFNDQLSGQAGRTQVLRNNAGQVIEYVERLEQVQHGTTLTLSLDSRIQYLAYRRLQAAAKKHGAMNASLVALDAKTGEILAMVSAPDFNPNDRGELKSSLFRNRAIGDVYEPGSTMKPFSVAMAIDANEVSSDTIIDAEQGRFRIGAHEISDTKKLGEITVADVISKSSNIGAAKVAMMLKPQKLYATYKDLGFGQLNELGLLGEQRGSLIKRKHWRPSEHATLSYGYGLSANTLQLARAYTALTNSGKLLPVSLTPLDEAPRGQRVFKESTVAAVNTMLELAVGDDGTAPKARIKEFRVAGKTGTAHRVVDGQYQEDSYMSLFAGFAPATDPEIILVVAINDPRGVDYYGGLVAAPVFREVMEGALRFRNVIPDAIRIKQDSPELMIARPRVANAPSIGADLDNGIGE